MMRTKSTDNKNINKKISTMNVSALVVFLLVFLLSIFAHANHVAIDTLNAEQQDCYICQQSLDTPPELPKIQSEFFASYCYSTIDLVSALFKGSDFAQPQLRAPPVFQ